MVVQKNSFIRKDDDLESYSVKNYECVISTRNCWASGVWQELELGLAELDEQVQVQPGVDREIKRYRADSEFEINETDVRMCVFAS